MVTAPAWERSLERRDAVWGAAARDAWLALLLTGGGDERLWLDPITRRNRYGAPARPAPDEIWLSSSTASAITEGGWCAAGDAFKAAAAPGGVTLPGLFDDIRARLLKLYGAPGAEAILCASGTEAELLTLWLVLTLAQGPVTNILVAPGETGSGVPAAAAGRHFLSCAALARQVDKGAPLPGWEDESIAVETIEIRLADGRPRAQADVDQEAAHRTERALAAGAFVLLHVMDASKTGRAGVSRKAAGEIVARAPGRVLAVVDACQLRAPATDLRADVAAGLSVIVTGSKFAGGPPFSGALILPDALAQRLSRSSPRGAPLAGYSARLDWPGGLRGVFGSGLRQSSNLGLALRWIAALAEIEAYETLSPALRSAILADFDRRVLAHVTDDPALALLDEALVGGSPGLTPVVHRDGANARSVYQRLRAPAEPGRRPCHLGQPVEVGRRVALRVCASMPLVTRAAAGDMDGVLGELDEAFDLWAAARRGA